MAKQLTREELLEQLDAIRRQIEAQGSGMSDEEREVKEARYEALQEALLPRAEEEIAAAGERYEEFAAEAADLRAELGIDPEIDFAIEEADLPPADRKGCLAGLVEAIKNAW